MPLSGLTGPMSRTTSIWTSNVHPTDPRQPSPRRPRPQTTRLFVPDVCPISHDCSCKSKRKEKWLRPQLQYNSAVSRFSSGITALVRSPHRLCDRCSSRGGLSFRPASLCMDADPAVFAYHSRRTYPYPDPDSESLPAQKDSFPSIGPLLMHNHTRCGSKAQLSRQGPVWRLYADQLSGVMTTGCFRLHPFPAQR